jgi:hypothetical protein
MARNNDDKTARSASRTSSGRRPTCSATTWTRPSTSTSCSGLIFLKYISDAFEERRAAPGSPTRPRIADPATPSRRRGPRRVHRRERVLGARGSALVPSSRARPSSPPSARPSTTRWTPSRPTTRRSRARLPKVYALPSLDKHKLGELIDLISGIGLGTAAHREKDTLGPRLRVLPLALRLGRRARRRRVLHAVERGARARRAAGALPGPRLRPLLRLGRHVRAVGQVHRRPRRPARRGDRLRPGVQPDHLAHGPHEHGDPGHRGQARQAARRHLPPRPAPRPARRLRDGQPAVQHQQLGRRAPRRRRALALRHPARRQRELRLAPAHRAPPRAHRHRRRGARQRLDVVAAVRRGGDPQASSSRPTSWTAWSPCPASCSTPHRSPSACGSWRATRAAAKFRAARARCCSSTPASSAAWRRACTGCSTPPTSRRSPGPTTPGATSAALRRRAGFLQGGDAREIGRTTSCSRRGATSGPRRSRTTGSPLRRRWSGW